MDRIIGSFLEINGDIVMQEYESKLPNFIKKIRSKYYRNKILKSVDKLRNSNYILTKENIKEFFSYVYNAFPPKGEYKSIVMTKNSDNVIESFLQFNRCKILITIYTKEEDFDIHINNNSEEKVDSYNLSLNKLYCDSNSKIREIIDDINIKLLNDICDYICDMILLYN